MKFKPFIVAIDFGWFRLFRFYTSQIIYLETDDKGIHFKKNTLTEKLIYLSIVLLALITFSHLFLLLQERDFMEKPVVIFTVFLLPLLLIYLPPLLMLKNIYIPYEDVTEFNEDPGKKMLYFFYVTFIQKAIFIKTNKKCYIISGVDSKVLGQEIAKHTNLRSD